MTQMFLIEPAPSAACPLTYVGNKSVLYDMVIQMLPPDTTEVVSPFCGSGALEIKLAASGIRVHAYDAFFPIPIFYQQMAKDAAAVVNEAESRYPMTAEVFETYRDPETWAELTPLQTAGIWWLCNKKAFSGFGLTRQPAKDSVLRPTPHYWNDPKWSSWRNVNFSCEHADWRDTLQRHPDSTLYLDPPYVSKENYYGFRDGQDAFPHEDLRDALASRTAPWILSYGPHELIKELYADFTIMTPEWKYTSGKNHGGRRNSEELLIVNFS